MKNSNTKVAIIGVAFKLANGINTMADYWESLELGKTYVENFPTNRIDDVLTHLEPRKQELYKNSGTFKGCFLDKIDEFDNKFFSIPPAEAKHIAPEHRLWLEVCTESIVDSGLFPEIRNTNTGVFLGASDIEYDLVDKDNNGVSVVGRMESMLATRIAYHYDLKGPSIVFDTACSSSLLAFCHAVESIQSGKCDKAIVGGVSLILYPLLEGIYKTMSTHSEDSKCRAFDENANGTMPGEGIISFILEPLDEAISRNHYIYGCIESFHVNSVGKGNGITAPSCDSQIKLINEALLSAQLKPNMINLVESHGTGTKLGDKIELQALKTIFNDKNHKVPVRSTKPNFGHLDASSGLLGVLSVLASHMFQKIPPSINCTVPNKIISSSNLYIPIEPIDLPKFQQFYSSVSSFGLSGTNVNMFLSSHDNNGHDKDSKLDNISMPLLICSYSFQKLKQQIKIYYNYIKYFVKLHKIADLKSICFTTISKMASLKSQKFFQPKIRLIIILNNVEQSLNIFNEILECDNIEDLFILENDKKELMCQNIKDKDNYTNIQPSMKQNLEKFLKYGEINENLISVYSESKYAPYLPLIIFDSVRHWPEICNDKDENKILCGVGDKLDLNIVELLENKLYETRELVRTLDLAPSNEYHKILNNFCSAVILKFILSTPLNLCWKKDTKLTTKDAFLSSKSHLRYQKLFDVMIRHLYETGLIECSKFKAGNIPIEFKIVADCEQFLNVNDPLKLANVGSKKYPAFADCFRFPYYCSLYHNDVLLRDMSPLSVIYPKGDLDFMNNFIKLGDQLGDVYYNLYMQIIAEYIRNISMKSSKKIRILEVGAGVGHVTRQLAPKLKSFKNVEYWFTDLGKSFVDAARKTFEYLGDLMRYAVFDITIPLNKQDIDGHFDIIVSYNVIHTTESISLSVSNLKASLENSGTLFIIESAKNETWSTLAWGLLDGWWYFKDYDVRPSDPMLDYKTWNSILNESGFKSVLYCPRDEEECKHVEKFLFICSNTELNETNNIESKDWWRIERAKNQDETEILTTDTQINLSEIKYKDVFNNLKAIWEKRLGYDNLKGDDVFRELGGESLLGIQMMQDVKKKFGIELEIAHVFAYPSLESLAKFIFKLLEEQKEANHLNSSTTTTVSNVMNLFNANEIMILFPGQGSEKASMCKNASENLVLQKYIKAAQEIVGYNILDKIKDTESFKKTEFIQVILFVSSVAKFNQLIDMRPELNERIKAVAGLSVGEFAALVVTGVLKFDDALRIVHKRGMLMQKEVEKCSTTMLSIFGPTTEALDKFLKKHFPQLNISSYLADNQHVVAGLSDDCDKLKQKFSDKNIIEQLNIIDVRKLRVAGAFHTKYMKNVKHELDELIDNTPFSQPKIPILMNFSGEATTDIKLIKYQIKEQVSSAVQWKKAMCHAVKLEIDHFIEISPASILIPVFKRINEFKNAEHSFEFIEI